MQTKKVYQLSVDNVLLGMTEALESPLEPGVFLIPGGCVDTDIEPPVPEVDEVVFWKDGAWGIGRYNNPNAPSLEQVAREWRDGELSRSDLMIAKIQDGMPNLGTITEWRKYRVALRTWPETEGFPFMKSAPSAPDKKTRG